VLAEAQTVVLAVKPQMWRMVAAEVAPRLHTSAALISPITRPTSAGVSAPACQPVP
jgi:pyrroline-5-carboxylate reductase